MARWMKLEALIFYQKNQSRFTHPFACSPFRRPRDFGEIYKYIYSIHHRSVATRQPESLRLQIIAALHQNSENLMLNFSQTGWSLPGREHLGQRVKYSLKIKRRPVFTGRARGCR